MQAKDIIKNTPIIGIPLSMQRSASYRAKVREVPPMIEMSP